MRALAYVLLILAALGADFASDIVFRPDRPDIAHGWDLTATLVVIAAFVLLAHDVSHRGGDKE